MSQRGRKGKKGGQEWHGATSSPPDVGAGARRTPRRLWTRDRSRLAEVHLRASAPTVDRTLVLVGALPTERHLMDADARSTRFRGPTSASRQGAEIDDLTTPD